MKITPNTPAAYKLLHEGTLALAQIEGNGIRVDLEYLDRAIIETGDKIKDLKAQLAESKVARRWKKHYRDRTNFNSTEQLGKVLFELLGFECPTRTATGKYATDEKTIEQVDHPFVRAYLNVKKYEKALGTYLMGWKREVNYDTGLLHAVFNLHLAVTYRSSSDSPNFQNVPVRNQEISKLLRRMIVARRGRRIIEIDYGGVEVKGAACYHKDPRMITYINDKTKDMHRDMAAECYMIPTDQVTKRARHAAKNKFVFPEFYGSYWAQVAPDLWSAIDREKLTTESGVPLKEWLRKKGVTKLGSVEHGSSPGAGTFAAHIQKVERRFWKERFPVYAQWKRDWFDAYQKRGWFAMLTGFKVSGFLKRNEVINSPVQGIAFHWMLWSLIQIQRELRRRKMKTVLIGQIHDSLIADVLESEREDYLEIARDVMTVKVRKHWPHIIVPLEIEVEQTPIEGDWTQKEKVSE